jgi:hypothetical protein
VRKSELDESGESSEARLTLYTTFGRVQEVRMCGIVVKAKSAVGFGLAFSLSHYLFILTTSTSALHETSIRKKRILFCLV